MIESIKKGELDAVFAKLYPDTECARARYAAAVTRFRELFGEREVSLISAPGRTEVGGNHTDHQRGRVLAASVDLDVLCVAARNEENVMRVHSEGYGLTSVNAGDLSVRSEDAGKTAALIRGVADWFKSQGYPVGGFDAYVTSDVPGGSGLSSSAAFEVAVGNTLKALYPCDITPVQIAIAGQYAENVHFGKPSGLMDQMASSVGGFTMIDFADPDHPAFLKITADLEDYALCVVETGGSHADLTPEYAAIPEEMHKISEYFGKRYLREVDPADFYANLAELRKFGDRAVLRAMHFYGDHARVQLEAEALRQKRVTDFLALIIESGRSSMAMLQNVFPVSAPQEQGVSLALALSEEILKGKGAWRVHGGGFAGTILTFVPNEIKESYREKLEAVFGQGSCRFLKIRPMGGIEVSVNG